MQTLRSLDNAKAWQMDYQRLLSYSDEENCYRLSERDINLLLSFVTTQATWATRWGGYEDFDDVSKYVADLTARLMVPSPSCVSEGDVGNDVRLGSILSSDNDEKEDEQMPQPQWQVINGTLYAGIDCSCGEVQWYPVGTSTGLGTGIYGEKPTNGDLTVSDVGVNGTTQVSCYASAAVDYLAAQVLAFTDWVVKVGSVGLDAALGELDDKIDEIAAGVDIVRTIVEPQEIIDYGIATFKAVLTSPSNIAALKANWKFTTVPKYGEIVSWVDTTNFVDGKAIAKKWWQAWARRVLMVGHAKKLNSMIISCGTGTATNAGTLTGQFTIPSGEVYKLTSYAWQVGAKQVKGNVTVNLDNTLRTKITGVYIHYSSPAIASGNNAIGIGTSASVQASADKDLGATTVGGYVTRGWANGLTNRWADIVAVAPEFFSSKSVDSSIVLSNPSGYISGVVGIISAQQVGITPDQVADVLRAVIVERIGV